MRFNLIDQVILCCSLEGILGGYCLSNADVDFVPCAASHLNILWLSSTFTIDYTTVFRLYCDTWTFSPFSVHLWGVITPLCSPQWTGLEHKHLFLSHNVILNRFKNSVMRSKDPPPALTGLHGGTDLETATRPSWSSEKVKGSDRILAIFQRQVRIRGRPSEAVWIVL